VIARCGRNGIGNDRAPPYRPTTTNVPPLRITSRRNWAVAEAPNSRVRRWRMTPEDHPLFFRRAETKRTTETHRRSRCMPGPGMGLSGDTQVLGHKNYQSPPMTALRQTVGHRGYFERVNWLGTTLRPLRFVAVEKGQDGQGLPPDHRPDPEPAREVWMATFHVLGRSPSGSPNIAAQAMWRRGWS
jgi:hypothetical protein